VLPAFLFGLLIIALLAVAVLVAVRQGRRVVVEPGREAVRPRPSLPVVLVHGFFGFDRLPIPGTKLDYFRGISTHLNELGCDTHAVRLPAAAAVPDRARALVTAIEALPHDRVDMIAHSLGGLDARYALSKLGLAKRVRSLVTIGTPHRGTPLADLATTGGALSWPRKIVAALGMPLHALDWLSTASLERFNRDVPDAAGVRYACVVGGLRAEPPVIPLPLVAAHGFLRRIAGANDGLVPMSSQYWGETLAEIEADHFAQVGWRVSMRGAFDALGLYAFIVSRLGDRVPVVRAAG